MNVVAIVLQVLLGVVFVMSGATKLTGQKMHVDNFDRWLLPQWFRLVTGVVEILVALGLIVGIWADDLGWWAAFALTIVMLVGILVHVRVKDPLKLSAPAIVLFVLSLVLFLILS